MGSRPAAGAGVVNTGFQAVVALGSNRADRRHPAYNSSSRKVLPREVGCRSAAAASRLALCATAHAAAALTQPRQTGAGWSSRMESCEPLARSSGAFWNGWMRW